MVLFVQIRGALAAYESYGEWGTGVDVIDDKGLECAHGMASLWDVGIVSSLLTLRSASCCAMGAR